MSYPLIAFDESGNTGQDLLNKEQPVFVLGSIYLESNEVNELDKIIKGHAFGEIKFNKLKKSKTGRKLIFYILEYLSQLNEKCKIVIYHKKYMIVAKIVDLLIEPLCHRCEFDLYKQGQNIALTNMLYYCMPFSLGETETIEIYKRFVMMIRQRTTYSIDHFYDYLYGIYNNCNDEDFKRVIELILYTRNIIDAALGTESNIDIDPAIPSFVDLAAYWSAKLNSEFNIVHDKSKPLSTLKDTLIALMSIDEPTVTVGYDRRKRQFPIKCNRLSFEDSSKWIELQYVDILVSSCSYYLKGLIGTEVNSGFFEALKMINLEKFIFLSVFPSPKVTPEELGTIGINGVNPIDYVVGLLRRRKEKK